MKNYSFKKVRTALFLFIGFSLFRTRSVRNNKQRAMRVGNKSYTKKSPIS